MANPEHVALVRKGAEAIAEWRRRHPRLRLDLSEAILAGADLSWANLSGADLSEAILFRAELTFAEISRADLTGTELTLAYVAGADLTQANLSQAKFGNTCLSGVDLSQVIGLATVNHEFPSSVGVDTLIESFRGAGNRLTPELVTFFRGAGVPQELLDALPGIVAEVKSYTCFIGYGQPDVRFARRLCEDLEAKGVSCWLYDMDATPGEPTWREIVEKRRGTDKMVVVCSAAALVRDGVLKEIEEQIDEGPDKLVPVSLDELWKEPGFRVMRADNDLKPFLMDRNYADFANLKYEDAFERLLAGLRRKRVRRKRA